MKTSEKKILENCQEISDLIKDIPNMQESTKDGINKHLKEVLNILGIKMTDKDIEQKWIELKDVLFDEDENGSLFLASDWWIFEKGTYREEGIWRWFDEHHSKGVGWLLNEFEER